MQKIITHLWYDTQAVEAAEFYCTLFEDSKVLSVQRITDTPSGDCDIVDFQLAGQRFMAISAGPAFTFNEAISLVVECADQAEIDYFWDRLTADGGSESACGWLKDKYGLNWQITPAELNDILTGPDAEGSKRAVQAMLGMVKLDIQALRAAYRG